MQVGRTAGGVAVAPWRDATPGAAGVHATIHSLDIARWGLGVDLPDCQGLLSLGGQGLAIGNRRERGARDGASAVVLGEALSLQQRSEHLIGRRGEEAPSSATYGDMSVDV